MIAFLSNLLILYPVAFSLFLALQLSEASADGRKATVGVQFVRSMIFVLFIFVLLAIGCRVSVLSILWIIIFGVMGVLLMFRQARLNRSAVAMTLLACDNRSQIQRATAFFAEDNSGSLGRRLNRLQRYLTLNMPWSTALEVSGFCRSSYESLLARLTERFGRSQKLTEDLNGPLRIEIELERMLARMSALTWIALFGPVFLLYRSVILPLFIRTLTELEVIVPESLLLLSEDGWTGSIATLVSLVTLAFFLVGVLIWMFPVLTLYYPFRLFSAAYFRCLGFVAFARVSERVPELVNACRETASVVSVKHIAERFEVAATALERGHAPANALVLAGLVKEHQLGDFTSILQASDVSWATRQLAHAEVERMLRRYSLAIQFLVVLFSLTFGFLVGLIGFGMFQALTVMIHSLSMA